MDLNEVKAFLAENKEVPEVVEFMNSMIKTPSAEELIRIPEVQKVIDQKVSLGINSFKDKTMPQLLEAEKKKMTESSQISPEMQRIQELEKKLAEKERNEVLGAQKSKMSKTFSEKNLPTDFVDYLVADNDEETEKRMQTFMESFGKYEQKIREEILKGHSTVVPKEKESKMTKEPGANATKEQWAEYTRAQLKNKE